MTSIDYEVVMEMIRKKKEVVSRYERWLFSIKNKEGTSACLVEDRKKELELYQMQVNALENLLKEVEEIEEKRF